MLETEIKNLTAAVTKLTALMEAQMTAPIQQEIKTETPETEKVDAAPIEQKSDASKAVSRDDLQNLCMEIVRGDRSKKKAVKDTIAEFDGASTLKDVKDADLQALHDKLSAL